MTIQVRLFALLRDLAGTGQVELSLQDGATVGEAADAMLTRYPMLRGAVSRVMYAVNQDYAAADTILKSEDELAIIPPVSGG